MKKLKQNKSSLSNFHSVKLALLLSLSILIHFCLRCEAADEQLVALSKEIVNEEIELTKLNTYIKLQSLPKIDYLRRWHLAQITNNTLTSSGAFLRSIVSLEYQEKPDRIPKYTIGAASIQRALANFISTAECSLEFGLEIDKHWKESRKGLSLTKIRRRGILLKNHIDELIESREQLEKSWQAHISSVKSENIALKNIELIELAQFELLYSNAKGLNTQKKTNEILTFIANLESGILTVIGLYGIETKHGTVTSRLHIESIGGFGDIIGGTIMAATPPAAELLRHYVEKKNQKTLAEILSTSNDIALPPVQIAPITTNNASSLIAEFCRLEMEIIEERTRIYNQSKRDTRAYNTKILLAAQPGSLTKIANGIGTIIGDFGYTKSTESRLQWIGGTALSYGAGNAISALINISNHIAEEAKHFKCLHENSDPESILKEQLEKLSAFQTQLQ